MFVRLSVWCPSLWIYYDTIHDFFSVCLRTGPNLADLNRFLSYASKILTILKLNYSELTLINSSWVR